MIRDLRVTVVSLLVVVSATCVVVWRARAATVPPPRARVGPANAAAVATPVRLTEPTWATEAEESFPRDAWSQGDDFHGKERDLARKTASERSLPVDDVLRAIDDDIHAARTQHRDAPDPRRAKAIPCKPRPFYD